MTDEALCGLLCVCLSVLLCSFFSFRFSLRTSISVKRWLHCPPPDNEHNEERNDHHTSDDGNQDD